MLRSVDNYQVEVLLSLALVAGGYALAERAAHVRADRDGGRRAADRQPRPGLRHVADHDRDTWTRSGSWSTRSSTPCCSSLIGLEVLALAFTGQYLLAGLLAIPIVLLARLVSVAGPIAAMSGGAGSPRGRRGC